MKREERMQCLSILEIITKLVVFQEKEIGIYDKQYDAIYSASSTIDMNKKQEENLRRMYQAACRLSDTMYRSFSDYSEKDNKYIVKPSVPQVAHKCLYAWFNAFDYLLGAAGKSYKAFLPPPEVNEYTTKSAIFRTAAIKEMNALFKRMKLDDNEVIEMRNRAISEVNSEKWYPYW